MVATARDLGYIYVSVKCLFKVLLTEKQAKFFSIKKVIERGFEPRSTNLYVLTSQVFVLFLLVLFTRRQQHVFSFPKRQHNSLNIFFEMFKPYLTYIYKKMALPSVSTHKFT